MTNALSIHNLCKTYPNGFKALKNIHLDVQAGDFMALLGPNGAGKSTTIGIICSLVTKTAGQVIVFDHDLDTARNRAKSYIGLVPQEFNFNQWAPVEEIIINQAGYYGIPRTQARVRAEYYLKQLGLWEKRRAQAIELSGGMKRRLMIARALVHEPKLLILDEPTAGVDIEIRRSMWDFLRDLNARGTTIILTTHYLEEAEQLCRRIAIIHDGQLVENTTIQVLLNQLHLETFVLNLKQPIRDVDDLKTHSDYPIRLMDDSTLEADVSKDRGLNGLFQILSEKHIEVISMRNKTNRLEELFMRLVEH